MAKKPKPTPAPVAKPKPYASDSFKPTPDAVINGTPVPFMRTVTVRGRGDSAVRVIRDEFTPGEMWAWCDMPAISSAHASINPASGGGDSWDRNIGYDKALKMAREGWPEGLAKVAPVVASVDELVSRAMPALVPVYDVVGDAPDVGAYLAGVPENMLTTEMQEGAARMIRVIINPYASASNSADMMEQRGIIACALADALERAGYRVELVVQDTSGTRIGAGPAHGFVHEVRCVFKRAEEPLNMDRLVFPVIHPAFMRRLIFRCAERLPKPEADLHTGRGYGSPYPIQGDAGDIIIGEITHDMNEKDLANEVKRYLAEVGVVMSENNNEGAAV